MSLVLVWTEIVILVLGKPPSGAHVLQIAFREIHLFSAADGELGRKRVLCIRPENQYQEQHRS